MSVCTAFAPFCWWLDAEWSLKPPPAQLGLPSPCQPQSRRAQLIAHSRRTRVCLLRVSDDLFMSCQSKPSLKSGA